ncbi:response regulator [Aspergillus chevalieri]|uniref:Response regulatory domain-containing protein n=1 Tax=Aspergillus chevalieri TaxID=182096 RepID=A0A7R7VJM7_ASPCH|nr:uncharacterized protein ACHE_21404A [Aspergillus chevalieri]BCR85946.1 hypothetical protein ACHE_21404A [Aspergillus chevalieri]
MPDRLSRLFKSKLLRRSSTSTVPLKKQKADSRAVDSSTLTSSPSDNVVSSCAPFFPSPSSPVESTAKPRAYSVVSSLPLDHPSSPNEILAGAGPATPATGTSADYQGHHHNHQQHQHHHQQGQYFDSTEGSESAGKGRPDEVRTRRGSQPKSSDRSSNSLDPGPTTTTAASAAADQWQQPDQLRKRNDFSGLQSTRLPISSLPLSDPFGGALHSPRLLQEQDQQRSGVNPTTTTTVDPRASTPSLAPVAELVPSDQIPNTSNYHHSSAAPPPTSTSSLKRPSLVVRRQSLLPPNQQHLVSGILDPGLLFHNGTQGTSSRGVPVNVEMPTRKIWVRRPGGSPTLVPILEDAVVDELRDQVIVKFTNSLGKTFDSPDIVIKIVPRDGSTKQSTPERLLNPEESLTSVLDNYFPGGQRVEDALIIDAPPRRTPKPSPRPMYYHHSDSAEHGDYFSIVPMNANVSTPPTHVSSSATSVNAHPTPSISILATGKAPPLPSPGSTRTNRHARRNPTIRHPTHPTNSPTSLQTPVQKVESVTPAVQSPQAPPAAATPPLPPPPESPQSKTLTPPTRGSSPRARPSYKDKKPNSPLSLSAAFGGLIEGTVPPINVLIVEDNIINQKLLEAFMKRLSVRWKCAANGEEAVKKWRQGGFHLVLMDIQLPVMNGLEATKEIRRLERLNGIGVFPKTPDGRSSATNANTYFTPGAGQGASSTIKEEDTLHDRTLFKSPVIIVALTASSLQSDRHEALAAGCNDFLTKPVGFPWLEQKVTEWGCMQALIDFDGWRKWRGFNDDPEPSPSPTTDGHTSPMHMSTAVTKPPSPVSPSSTRSPAVKSQVDGAVPAFEGEGRGEEVEDPPRLPEQTEIAREDGE